MQKLKKILLILQISFLNACTTPKPIIVDQYFYDANAEVCMVRKYKYSVKRIGPMEYFKKTDPINCNRLVGYKAKTYTKIVSWTQDIVDVIRKKLN